jgi:hypothetical protein
MSILKWKIRFKGILERKPHVLLIFHVPTIDAFVVRLLTVLCQMAYTSWSSGWRWAVATRVALNKRRYIGSAKLREIQSIAPQTADVFWARRDRRQFAGQGVPRGQIREMGARQENRRDAYSTLARAR